MKEITDDLLTKLAGPAAFQRGADYYREGRVTELGKSGKAVTAQVAGTEVWHVTLRHTTTVFEGSCDCPASENFEFCKHCVAVAMRYREGLERQDQLKSAKTKDRLPAYFMTWEKQDLVDLTLELLGKDRPRLKAFRIKADIAAGKTDDKAIKKQITAAIPYNRQLIYYRQVSNFFQGVESVLESLAPLIESLTPDKALPVIDYAMERIHSALATIDDSGGFRFHSVELLSSLHKDCLIRAKLNPAILADYLYRLYMEPASELYPAIPQEYLDILGEEGEQHFLGMIRSEWERLPPIIGNDREQEYSYRHLMYPLLEVARRSGDVVTEIDLLAKIANDFRDYLTLSLLCLKNNQLEQALSWRRRAEQDNNKPFHSKEALQENQIAIWTYTGEDKAVLQLRWEQFLSNPSLDRYEVITKLPGADKANTLKQKALTELAQIQSRAPNRSFERLSALNTEAEIFLYHNQNEDALNLAEKEALNPALILRIAIANNQFPERVLPLFFRVAAFEVKQNNNQSYKEAIKVLESCREQLPADALGKFEAGVKALHTEFKRKRNFAGWLQEAFPGLL